MKVSSFQFPVSSSGAKAVRAFLEPRHLSLATEVAAWSAREIPAAPDEDAAARKQAREILAKLGGAGWIGYGIPAAYGGQATGPDLRACALIREALAYVSPLADAVFALQCLGSMPVALAGDEAVRKQWLPRVARGEAMGAFAMTEPEAGSDVGAIQTKAKREGEFYVVEGRKIFISNAGIADFYTLFASTDPAAGKKGLSCFLVDSKTPGVRFAGAQIMSAPHPLGEMLFEKARVPAANRLGAEGEGFKLGMATLDRLRSTVAAAACGMAARALDEATRHAVQRRQFGKALSEFQMISEKLARMATELAAARLLVFRACWEADSGAERVTLESSMAKAYATEAAQRIVDDALQILGGSGMLANHPVERLYRSVRALRVYEGTTEIQNLVIAGQLVKESQGG